MPLWDGLCSHRSCKLRAHLDAQRARLQVERLPAYAPELNPVEYLWANPKGAELADVAGDPGRHPGSGDQGPAALIASRP